MQANFVTTTDGGSVIESASTMLKWFDLSIYEGERGFWRRGRVWMEEKSKNGSICIYIACGRSLALQKLNQTLLGS